MSLPRYIDANTWTDPEFEPGGLRAPRRHPFGLEAYQLVTDDGRTLIFPNWQAAAAWKKKTAQA